MSTGAGRVMAALGLVGLYACGSGQEGIPFGTYESIISGTSSELDGAWALTIEPDGRFRIALNGQPAVTGDYAYDGGRVTFTDDSGPMMCAAGVTRGSYTWRIDDAQLTLTALADECPGRRGILTHQPYRRKTAD